LSLSGLGRFERFDAGNQVVPLRLGRETVGPIRARIALVALSTICAVSASRTLRPLRPLRTRRSLRPLRALRTLLAPRRLSSASLLNTVKLSRSNRGAARRAVGPLIRLKSHQASSPCGKIESPGNVDAPGVISFPQRPQGPCREGKRPDQQYPSRKQPQHGTQPGYYASERRYHPGQRK